MLYIHKAIAPTSHKKNMSWKGCPITVVLNLCLCILFSVQTYTYMCYFANCHIVSTYGMCSYSIHICVRTKTRADTCIKITSYCICFGDVFTTACAPTSEKYVSGRSLGRTLGQKQHLTQSWTSSAWSQLHNKDRSNIIMARTEMLERINLDFATLRVSDSDELFKSWPANTSWSQCMDMYVCEHIYIYIYVFIYIYM